MHSIEFQNPYMNSIEQKPEIINIVENNYKIARRIYQDLYIDVADLFQEFIRSLPPQDIQDINDDIKTNGWGVKSILNVENSLELLNIFQTFYHTTGRLPLPNGLLIVPDGDAPEGDDRVNMKSLYDMFRHTYSHSLVSLPFLRVIHYYFDATDLRLTKNARTKLYRNLSHKTLSGARNFEFENVSDLTARISFFVKSISIQNTKKMEREDQENAYKINTSVSYATKTEDHLDDVIDILDDDIEHKKTTHPYVPKEQFDKVGNVGSCQTKKAKTSYRTC